MLSYQDLKQRIPTEEQIKKIETKKIAIASDPHGLFTAIDNRDADKVCKILTNHGQSIQENLINDAFVKTVTGRHKKDCREEIALVFFGIPGIKDALKNVKQKVFAISPIIEGAPIKGPADKLMRCLGLEVSCVGVAKFYEDILGHFIIDNKDCNLKSEIEELGIHTYCYDTIMDSIRKKKELAQFLVDIKV